MKSSRQSDDVGVRMTRSNNDGAGPRESGYMVQDKLMDHAGEKIRAANIQLKELGFEQSNRVTT